MPEAAVVPTSPVPSAAPKAAPAAKESAPAPKPKSKLFINEPTDDQVKAFSEEVGEPVERTRVDMDDVIDRVQRDNPTAPGKKPAKKAVGEPAPTGEKLPGEQEDGAEPKPAAKKKYTVGGKQYELTPEQADRFTQKGIHYEKEAIERKKYDAVLNQRLEKVEAREQQIDRIWEALEKDPRSIMLQLHGPQRTREIFEPVLAEQVREELMPEHEKAVLREQRRAEAAESRLQEIEQREAQTARQQEEAHATTHFETLITKALQQEGIPKNDQTVSEMARWLRRVEARNAKLPENQQIQVTPERLAKVVREDNIEKSRALVDRFVNDIDVAKKAGDTDAIVRTGEALVELFGEPVVKAIAQFHLARLRKSQPTVPQKIVEQPRQAKPEQKRRGYMDPDQYAEERRKRAAALDRNEEVADWND